MSIRLSTNSFGKYSCGWAEYLVALPSAAPGQEVWKALVLGALWLLSPVAVGSRTPSVGLITFFVTSQETTNILGDQPLGMIWFSLQMLSAGLCE